MVKFYCGNLVTPVPERFTWLPCSPMSSSSPPGLHQGPWRTRSAGSCCRRRCQGWRSWVCFAVGPGRLSPYRTGKRVAVGRHRGVDIALVDGLTGRLNLKWPELTLCVFFLDLTNKSFCLTKLRNGAWWMMSSGVVPSNIWGFWGFSSNQPRMEFPITQPGYTRIPGL